MRTPRRKTPLSIVLRQVLHFPRLERAPPITKGACGPAAAGGGGVESSAISSILTLSAGGNDRLHPCGFELPLSVRVLLELGRDHLRPDVHLVSLEAVARIRPRDLGESLPDVVAVPSEDRRVFALCRVHLFGRTVVTFFGPGEERAG